MGYIYFIQEGSNGAIKIGFTSYNDVYIRLGQLQTGNPNKLTVIKVIEGTMDTEKCLHKLFNEYRLNGEWFSPSKPLYDFIYKDSIYKNVRLDNLKLQEIKSDSGLSQFLDYHIIKDDNSYVISKVLYEKYIEFCKEYRIKPLTHEVFGKMISKYIHKKQKRINGIRANVYDGIKLVA